MKQKLYILMLFFSLLVFAIQPVRAQGDQPLVFVMTIDGPIIPSAEQYLERVIKIAEQRQAELLVLQLNTPGGDSETMFDMTEAIRACDVPVVVYVTPRGAMAGSAGVLITLAGHAAAMTPETAIGAASPVGSQGEDLPETAKEKFSQIVKASIRSLAEDRPPEAIALAEETIDTARAVSAREALEVGLVDMIAGDLEDLLAQLDGYEVQMPDGPRSLNTANADVQELPMTFIEQLLNILVDPNIVFLLTTIGVQAILIEISSPGGWVAGFIGVVCLALAAYGFGVLPVNWFGVIFLVTALVLFILDIKAPTHGALTAAGVGSFIAGALILFNSPGTPQFQRVSVPLVVMSALLMGGVFFVAVGFAIRAQRAPVRTGHESLDGKVGIATTAIKPTGQVQLGSELWTAQKADGSGMIHKGDSVEVVDVSGLRLIVRKKV
ncbi:MAG: nodulation protein NfeD [Anaerolineales bacterium]|nr:nodulation protein NfeD [Anaerolineales bacterium]